MSRRPTSKLKQCSPTEAVLAVERCVLPSKSIACLVLSVLEALLFERGQVPCVVKLLRRDESQETGDGGGSGGTRASSFRRDRNKFLEQMKSIDELLRATLACAPVECVTLLLGSTTVSAKEIYEIDIRGIVKGADGDPVNNDRLCRTSLISILSGNVEWSQRLKSARRIMRAFVLLKIPGSPPQHLGLHPVRAYRVPRAAAHVRFIASGPSMASGLPVASCGDHSSAAHGGVSADSGRYSDGIPTQDSNSIEADQGTSASPVEASDRCSSNLTAAAECLDDDAEPLATMVDALDIGAAASDLTGQPYETTDVMQTCSASEPSVVWFQIPVALKGFSGLQQAR